MNKQSFIFYESWSMFIDNLERETAKELVYQIYLVGMGKELDTDDENIVNIINAFILPNIKGAQKRYATAVANGSKGGRKPITTKEQDLQIYQLHLDGWTYEQIAEEFGIDKNTVGNRVRRLRNELKTKNQNKNQIQEPNTNTFKDNNKNNSNNNKENEEDKDIPLHYNF